MRMRRKDDERYTFASGIWAIVLLIAALIVAVNLNSRKDRSDDIQNYNEDISDKSNMENKQ